MAKIIVLRPRRASPRPMLWYCSDSYEYTTEYMAIITYVSNNNHLYAAEQSKGERGGSGCRWFSWLNGRALMA